MQMDFRCYRLKLDLALIILSLSLTGGNVPIDWRYAVLTEIGVGLGEWRTAKKSIMRGQWRGVGAG